MTPFAPHCSSLAAALACRTGLSDEGPDARVLELLGAGPQGRPAAEQYRLFEELVRKPNAAVYEGVFHGVPKPPAEFVPKSLEGVPAIEASMRELSQRLSAELPAELDAFRKTFPRFQCSTPVYFLYSAGAFDGATRDVNGKTALMFGLDVIARLKEELSPLVVHELFHVYHERGRGRGSGHRSAGRCGPRVSRPTSAGG